MEMVKLAWCFYGLIGSWNELKWLFWEQISNFDLEQNCVEWNDSGTNPISELTVKKKSHSLIPVPCHMEDWIHVARLDVSPSLLEWYLLTFCQYVLNDTAVHRYCDTLYVVRTTNQYTLPNDTDTINK